MATTTTTDYSFFRVATTLRANSLSALTQGLRILGATPAEKRTWWVTLLVPSGAKTATDTGLKAEATSDRTASILSIKK